MTDWTDGSPFCFKACFPFLDSHPNLLMHLCPLGHWTRTHYSNCGNGNVRCRATLTSYPVAASAWMFKQGMGTSLLPIKSLRNSWSAACHCGLQVQQGFTISGALCQNKSTLPCWVWAKAQAVFCCGRGQVGDWEAHFLTVSIGCAAILNPCGFFPVLPIWTHLFQVG